MDEKTSDRFEQPQTVTEPQRVFGGDALNLMPPMADIPTDYPDRREWTAFAHHWFFSGDPFAVWDVGVRDGVDPDVALRHLETIKASWAPKHEHKEAAVAWLASRWYDGIARK